MTPATIAYFSMEIGLEAEMPTYSGGLGVLSGDTVHSAADLALPMVAVTLLHRQGHARQILDAHGVQREEQVAWVVNERLRELAPRVTVSIEGRQVHVRAWQYEVKGVGAAAAVPVLFLDADLAENAESDRALTGVLYGRDARYRASQEAILGIGGIRMLRALGYHELTCFHLNEGHAGFLTLELLREELERAGRSTIQPEDVAAVRRHCVFTTHTPVPAGHDRFPPDMVRHIVGDHPIFQWSDLWLRDHAFNMTHLAMAMSRRINGVSQRHGEVVRQMTGRSDIEAVTNGVHAVRWTSAPFAALFDHHLAGWREDNARLREAAKALPPEAVWQAHQTAKQALLACVRTEARVTMSPDVLTIGFARRATAYKRADLLLADLERLRQIALEGGGLQVIFAGKAHPHDTIGKAIIQRIFLAKTVLGDDVKVAYLADYNMALAKQLVSGADLWLNTPQAPLEASGTSGMKAALNGVPSLSVLDGWWVEGWSEGVTGWAMEGGDDVAYESWVPDVDALYGKLRRDVIPTYYTQRDRWVTIMRSCIALNGSHFNTQRMMQDYVTRIYA